MGGRRKPGGMASGARQAGEAALIRSARGRSGRTAVRVERLLRCAHPHEAPRCRRLLAVRRAGVVPATESSGGGA